MKNLGFVWLLGVLATTACSGRSDSGALPMAQAGSGNLPLPAQAGVSFSLEKATPAIDGMTCPVPGQTFQVGAPTPPSLIDPGDGLVDGSNATIVCSVKGSGPFTFSASVHAITTSGTPYPLTLTFSNGQVTGGTGTATVSVYTPQLASTFTSEAPCQVWVVQNQIQAGALWAHFSCPTIESPPASRCRLEGVIVLENCDGS